MGKKDQYQFGEQEAENGASTESAASNGASPSSQVSASPQTEAVPNSTEQSASSDDIDINSIPFKLRREGVKDGRNAHSLYLQSETERAIREVRSQIEDEFPDERHYKLDIYEIVMLNGLFGDDGSLDLDGIKEQAQKFGYGLR